MIFGLDFTMIKGRQDCTFSLFQCAEYTLNEKGQGEMRFFYVKNEQTCKGCGSTMFYGDEAVVILINYVRDGDATYKVPLTFHVGCYLEWDSQMYISRLERWRQGSIMRPPRRRKPKPKIGRPRRYNNGIKAHRLQSLLCYRKKAGNIEAVERLEDQIASMVIQNTMENVVQH